MKSLNLPKERAFTGPAILWKRAAAFAIDMLILNFFVFYPFRSIFEGIIPEGYSFTESYRLLSSSDYIGYIGKVSIAMSALAILYFFLLERKMSQTIGKRLMKIYVASDTNEMKKWQLLVRNIVLIPLFPFVLLWIIDPLFMAFTKSNQRLSEILSRTKVVEVYRLE